MLVRRKGVAPGERDAAGRAVASHLARLAAIAKAPRVALYAALADEVPTRPAFDALAKLGCRRLFPRMTEGRLEFAEVGSWEELVPGPLGVLAPPDDRQASSLRPEDVAVLPGVAFDLEGNRLGRGGGYYDRTFAADPPLLVGLGYQLQLVPRVPNDSRDRPMDAIVTEQGVQLGPGPRGEGTES